ncbi:MAG: aminotransferase class V-fold PLP-dependent enzyme [Planctomycetota bacterium]|jgi:kynureninase
MSESEVTNGALLEFRKRFPILSKTNYLISNSLGAMPDTAADSVGQYAEIWKTRGVRAWEEAWWTMASDVGNLVAPLIGADENSVIFHPNVTIAHAVIFSAFDYKERKKVVTDDMHFPSILYLLKEQEKLGADIDVVPSEDGISIGTEKIIDAIDHDTAFVTISHVLFKSAYIHEVEAIARAAREKGAIVIVDGYQAVGIIPVDVRKLGADVYIGGCLKWLCGGPGNAFLWVGPEASSKLNPRFTGWFSHKNPFAFETTHERREDSWKFFTGTSPIPCFYAARPGLEIINSVGVDSIRERSMMQTKRLLELAAERGYSCSTPADPGRRGGTVAIDVEHAREVSAALKAREILCDFRAGAGIRFSPHFYNTDKELDEAVAAIGEVLETGEWKKFEGKSSVVT